MGNVAVESVPDAICRAGGSRTGSGGVSFASVAFLGGTGVMGWLLKSKRVEEVMVEVRFVGIFSVVPLLLVVVVMV